MEIEKYLLDKGILPNIKGFDYLVESIKLVRRESSYKKAITKRLYPDIAKMFKDTPTRVERAMRHAIKRIGLDYAVSEFIALAEIETRMGK